MPGGVRDGLPIEDATPKNLWARLLAGQVTEVYMLYSPSGPYEDLPRKLGLDLISPDAYVYGRYGVLRTHRERAELARVLAGEPRWLAVGRLPYWAEPFARRAEAILIPVSRYSKPTPRSVAAFFRKVPRELFELHDEQEWTALEADPDFAAASYVFDALASIELFRVYHMLMAEFLLREFPSKTFMVGAQRAAQLKTVRPN